MLLRPAALSFCCSLVNGLIFLWAEQKWKHMMRKRNQKEGVSSVYTPFWSRTVVCMIVGMPGCTVWRCLSFEFVDWHTHTNTKWYYHFLFYFVADTYTCDYMQTCLQPLKHAQKHTHTHTSLAMYHGGLPCCLSNQRMGSFQLHWSEHIIPFPSSPLLNTQTHKYMTYIRMHTLAKAHTSFPLTRQESPRSPIVNPKDWCDSSDKMRLCVITRHYTTEPLRNWISLECHGKHSLYTQQIVSQIMNRPLSYLFTSRKKQPWRHSPRAQRVL